MKVEMMKDVFTQSPQAVGVVVNDNVQIEPSQKRTPASFFR